MNLTLVLNAEIEAKRKELAAITGRRMEDLEVEALQDKLARELDSTTLPMNLRLAELEA